MRVTDLPAEVLGDVMRLAGQPGRTACMLASKALLAAADAKGSWDRVTFRDLDGTAVRFMQRHRCATVCVRTSTPDDVSWFLDALADGGCNDCVTDLALRIGEVQRLPGDLLDAVARHWRLRRLDVTIARCETTCEIGWPRVAHLPELRDVRILERTPGPRNVVLWFDHSHPRFVALERLRLGVALSDVLTGVYRMPRLRHLSYRFEGEGALGENLDDACLDGMNLDVLELDVTDDTDTRNLFDQLRRCSVRRLVLHMHDDFLDLSQPLSAALEELVIGLCTPCVDVNIDFQCLASHHRLRDVSVEVTAPWISEEECHPTLAFQHVDGFASFLSLFARVTLDYPPGTRVCMSPLIPGPG